MVVQGEIRLGVEGPKSNSNKKYGATYSLYEKENESFDKKPETAQELALEIQRKRRCYDKRVKSSQILYKIQSLRRRNNGMRLLRQRDYAVHEGGYAVGQDIKEILIGGYGSWAS